MLNFKDMLLPFLEMSPFRSIAFCYILHNTLCKTELCAEYRYSFSNYCLRYYVMERLSSEQRVLIVKTFYENGECVTYTVRKLRNIFGRNKAPCDFTVRRLLTKFETTGLVLSVKSPGRKRSCRTEEHFILVLKRAAVSLEKSIR